MLVLAVCFALQLLLSDAASAGNTMGTIVLRNANFSAAAELFAEEHARRSDVNWTIVDSCGRIIPEYEVIDIVTESDIPCSKACAEALPTPSTPLGAEEYRLCFDSSAHSTAIQVSGLRSAVFGVGKVLRTYPNMATTATATWVSHKPEKQLRGHMISYRALSNSYDGWTAAMMEQYIRDLAIYGTNFIELVAPDDTEFSPSRFAMKPTKMCQVISSLATKYGLGLWMWWPVNEGDYSGDAKLVAKEVERVMGVVRSMVKLDALFIPGGDPGGSSPESMFALVKAIKTEFAIEGMDSQLWLSGQGFNASTLDTFIELSNTSPDLDGMVYGPHTRIPIDEMRSRLNASIPLRHYPDIGHDLKCEFPVPSWTIQSATTIARENYNPRPAGFSKIFRLLEPHADGFGAYSDGSADDLNKFVWSILGWDSSTSPIDFLTDYARTLVFPRYTADTHAIADFVLLVMRLEDNWNVRNLIEAHAKPFATLEAVLQSNLGCDGKTAEPISWRLQHACYRAYYDAYVASRTQGDDEAIGKAKAILREEKGAESGLARALAVLESSKSSAMRTEADEWRKRIFELADDLFHSISIKLSVPLYGANGIGRGASLDTIDAPTTDRPWLAKTCKQIMTVANESTRVQMINEMLDRTTVGEEEFYDNLGTPGEMPHLLPGVGFDNDPSFFKTPLSGFQEPFNVSEVPVWPAAWYSWSQALYDNLLELRYDNLNRSAQYEVQVVYSGDAFGSTHVTLSASADQGLTSVVIDGPRLKPNPPTPLVFDLPIKLTRTGSITLIFSQDWWVGGNGRGCQVAEIWIKKKRASSS